MVQLTTDQRVWVCLEMARVNNALQVRRLWANQFPGVQPPTARTIRQNYRKYRTHGTSLNRNQNNSGRRRTARSVQNIRRVRRSLQRNGNVTSRRNGLNLSRSSFNRIVRLDIHFFPYVLIKRQALRPQDPAARLVFCRWFTQQCNINPVFLQNVVTSDEAIFSLNSEVNTRNVVRYAPYGDGHPPDHYIEHVQGADQLMVWVGLTGNGDLLGPHFVRGNLDTREYLRIVRYNVIQREFRNLGMNDGDVWWQQDGATPHTSNQSMNYLRGKFPGKLISKRGDFPWPPRSPDLTILDFFFWGYIKHKIWNVPRNQQPTNLNQLQAAIVRECRALQRAVIISAFPAMVRRCEMCINVNGNHFQDE